MGEGRSAVGGSQSHFGGAGDPISVMQSPDRDLCAIGRATLRSKALTWTLTVASVICN